jgi:hypothetical protein
MRKTQLSLWLLNAGESTDVAASMLQVVLSRSISLENLSKDGEVQFANSTVSLANFTGFAVVGELEAEGVLPLSKSKSSNMSTAENTIQDRTSRTANAF